MARFVAEPQLAERPFLILGTSSGHHMLIAISAYLSISSSLNHKLMMTSLVRIAVIQCESRVRMLPAKKILSF